eukprot:CAMPEP_0180608278 /NCGR_PEP_ID=MMETSP1037_2-20121125/28154_1 /TAXON_ID=632150 /ORGANISM="Azadinium spinosum, Strain 3D9" /LENGTH=330 /DNA_ID=CAMNT_0022627625 /DNA_START=12 /DNA_END=1001 /DNA_ORIENTATION=-
MEWDLFGTDPLFPSSQLLALVCLILALLWSCRASKTGKQDREEALLGVADCPAEGFEFDEILSALGAPENPHEEGAMIPPIGMIFDNSVSPFDNDFAGGRFLSIHRATYDKSLDKSGNYPYGEYFRGKKRLWEARFQFTLKQPVEQSELFFGIELENYVPMSAATKQVQSMLVRMLKGVVGDHVYHSPGDDPKVVTAEREDPIFAMPMWAFDQFIVTPEGEDPPDIRDPALSSTGCKRFKRVKEFQKEMADVKFVVGPTYTFCFWGISQFLDKLNWKVRIPFMKHIDFDVFAGSPPVHVIIYSLTHNRGDANETRHLASRKKYLFNIAFW